MGQASLTTAPQRVTTPPKVVTEPLSLEQYIVLYWKGVVYGPPGCGKSVFAGTSQKYRTFVFDCDDGLSSVKAFQIRNGLRQDLVKFWPVKTHQDFLNGWKWLRNNYTKFDLVVLDTMTELQKIVKREVATKTGHETIDLRDWGVVLDILDLTSANFKGMPFHMLILCHETLKEDPVIGVSQYRPSFQGTYKYEYARHFGFMARYTLWWANKKEGEGAQAKVTKVLNRFMDFGPNPSIHFKDRSGAMARWEKPNIDDILDKMIASQGDAETLLSITAGNNIQPTDPGDEAATIQLQKQQQDEQESE